jgi:hypothetical protein
MVLYLLHPEKTLINKQFFLLQKYCDMFSTFNTFKIRKEDEL